MIELILMIIKSQGFSLIELMSTMVIMGIITMSITTMMKNQSMAVIKIQAEYDMQSTLIEIGNFLSNPTYCQDPTVFGGRTLPVAAGAITAFTNGSRTYTADTTYSSATRYGNSNIAIHSFVLAAASASVATLTINFYQKNNISLLIPKYIDIYYSVSGATINKCNSLGYRNPNGGNGISACPVDTGIGDGFSMVGTSSSKTTYCIHTLPRIALTYANAVIACQAISDTTGTGMGAAHLCDFSEWSNACYLKASAAPAITIGSAGLASEWISGAPTTNAEPLVPTASKMAQLGDLSMGVAPTACITGKVDADPNIAAPYRCCFH